MMMRIVEEEASENYEGDSEKGNEKGKWSARARGEKTGGDKNIINAIIILILLCFTSNNQQSAIRATSLREVTRIKFNAIN